MKKCIIADINEFEARVALLEDKQLVEIQVERRGKERLVGNIYKGRVENILPGMQAAFVDIGLNRNAFLYAGDILVDKADLGFEGEIGDSKVEVPNIKDILKVGQEIIVQVLKQPGGSKGARVTTHITLPARSLVLMPTVNHIGVSRKISEETERERLKDILEEIKPKNMGLIVRTVAEGKTREDFENEIEFLTRLYERIVSRQKYISAPRVIHAEESLVFRTVRDMFISSVDEFIINDSDAYQRVKAVAKIVAPVMYDKIKLYKGEDNIFDHYDLNSKIDKALSNKVWLKSGGYLIIDEAEALTVIDVNTGKYVGTNDFQETILKTNIEAAQEISKQLRLRDVSGIIIVDFIDMDILANKDKIVEELKNALKSDRTKTNVLGITELGLVEMTRKKVRRKLSSLVKMNCPYCSGSGYVFSLESMSLNVKRRVEAYILGKQTHDYLIEVHPKVLDYIMKKIDKDDKFIPNIVDKRFYIKAVNDYHIEDINIMTIGSHKELEKHLDSSKVYC
jgi:ribonuclease G